MAERLEVLAIGLDSLERALVDRLMVEGRMPVLKKIAETSRQEVVSTASVGSGSVWPSFITGREPVEHGVANEWMWDAARMAVSRFNSHGLTPFWQPLAERGIRVGI